MLHMQQHCVQHHMQHAPITRTGHHVCAKISVICLVNGVLRGVLAFLFRFSFLFGFPSLFAGYTFYLCTTAAAMGQLEKNFKWQLENMKYDESSIGDNGNLFTEVDCVYVNIPRKPNIYLPV